MLSGLKQDLGPFLGVRHEVRAPGGIPDLVFFLSKNDSLDYVITVEFKLSDWRRALFQAFKNRNFGNEAYVVLDPARLDAALKHLSEFQRANVGLATVSRDCQVSVWLYPTPALPFSEQFSEKLATILLRKRKAKIKDLRFIRTVRGGVPLADLRRSWGALQYLQSDKAS
jgi:hypothetical protein